MNWESTILITAIAVESKFDAREFLPAVYDSRAEKRMPGRLPTALRRNKKVDLGSKSLCWPPY